MQSPADTYLEVVALIRNERRVASALLRDRFGLTVFESKKLMEAICESIAR